MQVAPPVVAAPAVLLDVVPAMQEVRMTLRECMSLRLDNLTEQALQFRQRIGSVIWKDNLELLRCLLFKRRILWLFN